MKRHDVLALVLLTSIISVLFIDILAGINSLYLRDLVHYHYPAKKVLRDVVMGGEFPYWNRAIAAGQPLAANPAHEVFYPLTWLILLPSYDYGFQLFILIHLYIAAWGMYAFLRSLNLGPPASCFGALSFALGGVMLSYLTILPFLAAAVWIPPALLFTRRFLLHRHGRDFALATLFFAVQLLVGEPTTLVQTGLLAGMYAIWRGPALRNVLFVGLISLAALCLSAVATLPTIDHAGDSSRARGFVFSTVTNWSMPAVRVGEFFYPHMLGHNMLNGRRLYWGGHLYPTRGAPFVLSIYPGLFVSVLAFAALFARMRGTRLVLIILAVSFILALGYHTPLWQLLYATGLARSVRYPEKFILMGVFALIVFAAKMLERILDGDDRARTIALRVAIGTTAFAAVAAVVALTPWHAWLFAQIWKPAARLFTEMVVASRSGWILAAARGLLLLVLLRTVLRARRAVWLGIAATFVVLDLATLMPEMAARTSAAYLNKPPQILAQLPPEHDRYRLFHHGAWHRSKEAVAAYYRPHPELYWIYRNAAMPLIPGAHGVQTVLEVDYDYTGLLTSTDFSDSVRDLSNLRRDWLDVAASMSNIWYRAVFIDPNVAFARANGNRRFVQPVGILRHPRYPRYWFARKLETIRNGKPEFVEKLGSGRFGKETTFIEAPSFVPAPGAVRGVRETANTARLEVETAGRAFLVMSVTAHKYWSVTIDGADSEVITTNVGFQGVVVPAAGHHVVEMRYHNPLIAAGAAVSVASLLALLYVAFRTGRAG